jgi:hypothetical protein
MSISMSLIQMLGTASPPGSSGTGVARMVRLEGSVWKVDLRDLVSQGETLIMGLFFIFN